MLLRHVVKFSGGRRVGVVGLLEVLRCDVGKRDPNSEIAASERPISAHLETDQGDSCFGSESFIFLRLGAPMSLQLLLQNVRDCTDL